MTLRIMLAALALSVPSVAFAQAAPPMAPAPKEDLVRVALDTERGRIVLALDKGRAPITTGNFLAYVDKGLFNGETFYRAFKYGDGGIIQGGARSAGKQLPVIAISEVKEIIPPKLKKSHEHGIDSSGRHLDFEPSTPGEDL